jgi:hypothetical protein
MTQTATRRLAVRGHVLAGGCPPPNAVDSVVGAIRSDRPETGIVNRVGSAVTQGGIIVVAPAPLR